MAKNPADDPQINSIEWDVFLKNNEKDKINISFDPGQCLFIVGANGSGKSALIQQFVAELFRKDIYFERYAAHRQPWIEKHIASTGRSQEESLFERKTVMDSEANRLSRWSNTTNEDNRKHTNTFHDLVEKWKAFSHIINGINDDSKKTQGEKISEIDKLEASNPLNNFNDLLKHGNIPITFQAGPNDNQFTPQHNDNGANVDIRALSDGERSVVLFAATAITMPPGTVLLIDEPDLHLHQSIVDPFFSALTAFRKDCFFVFSTHNLSFPSAHPESQVIIARSCDWALDAPSRFDVELLGPDTEIPEHIRQDILGARKEILFVEGEESSLDARLYRRLFPDMKVIPKGGYGRVDKAVTGMNESAGLHHVRVWGLVDKDMRSGQDISNTLGKNIWVLTVWEIESLYYTTDAIRAVAGHQMKNKKITSHIGHLYRILSNAYDVLKQEQDAKIVARDISKRKMRKESENKIRSMDTNRKASLESKATQKIIIEIEDSYFDDLDSFMADVNSAASGKNNEKAWNTLLKQYPIHKTSAFGTIANVLKLDKKGYENTLLSLVQENEVLARKLKEYISYPFG